MLLKNGLLAILVCLLFPSVFSQSSSVPRTLKVSFGLSGFSYLGDFASGNGRIQRVYPGANISIYTESPSPFQLQLNGGFGKFAAQYEGEDAQSGQLTHTFVETPFYYGDLRLRYRILQGDWQPYAAIGAGILVFSPRDENGKPLKFIDESREEGEVYNTIIPELPLSLGIEKRINDIVNVGFEYTLRYTPTDYLDNVGQKGSRPGKDLLHAATLTFAFALPNKKRQEEFLATTSESQIPNTQIQGEDSVLVKKVPDSLDIEKPISSMDSVSTPNIVEEEVNTPKVETPLIDAEMDEKIQTAIEENQFLYYKVKKGDTLDSIAESYKMSLETLKDVNFMKDEKVKKGAYLRIPKVE